MRRLSWSLTCFSFARIRLAIVMRFTQNRPFLRRRADMRETEKVERFRLALAPGCPVADGEPPELDQPGLLRVQLQPELREPLPQVGQEPLCVPAMLEPHDEIVGVAHDDHITACLSVSPPVAHRSRT